MKTMDVIGCVIGIAFSLFALYLMIGNIVSKLKDNTKGLHGKERTIRIIFLIVLGIIVFGFVFLIGASFFLVFDQSYAKPFYKFVAMATTLFLFFKSFEDIVDFISGLFL